MFDRPPAAPSVPSAFGRVLVHLDGRDGHDRPVQLVVTDRLVLYLNADRRGLSFDQSLEAVAPHRSLTVARLYAADTGWFGKVTALTVAVGVGNESLRITARAEDARAFMAVLAGCL